MCAPTKMLQSCVSLPLEEAQLVEVVEKAKDWAIMHGAAMRSKANFNPDALTFAPFVLTPSSFPRKEFQKAVELQPVLNELIHAVAHDAQFLQSTLASTEKVDEFTSSLISIYRTVLSEGITQPISLGLLRSDLMLETQCDDECSERTRTVNAYCCWKQVEINTIASGFGHLGPSSKALQRTGPKLDAMCAESGKLHWVGLPLTYYIRLVLEIRTEPAARIHAFLLFNNYKKNEGHLLGRAKIQNAKQQSALLSITKPLFRPFHLLCSDYLPDFSDAIKQVEINTIASSFGGISTNMSPMHSFVLTELGHRDKLENLPVNNALSGLCDAMVEAWKLQDRPSAAILFVVEDVTYNICDQRFHEFYIRETYPHVAVIRRTLTQIHQTGRLGERKELLIDGTEASVVYFRAGYEPGHYHGQAEWDARLLVERSLAIKCPSIQYHLAGTKKVQQALAKPSVLRQFVGDARKIEAIYDIFTGLYSLDQDEGGDGAVALALTNPDRYVLKPQREGGGNNVYGGDIPAALQAMSSAERSAWILMERIIPPLSTGYLVRPGGPSPPPLVQLISELGIFGTIIGTKDKVLYNKQVGHMLRTKLSSSNEGGVAAGSGALDSPYLID
uniref:Glutathione synthetase n=1 Tax=Anopheles dirus TaxID=7168 RepID=A0A182N092_9DIPT